MSINSVSRRGHSENVDHWERWRTSVLRVIPAHAAEYAQPHGGGGESCRAGRCIYSEVFSPRDYKDTPGAVPGHHSGGQRMRRRD